MRSTLLIASFLAVLPIVSAVPQGSFRQSVHMSDGRVYKLQGCRDLTALQVTGPLPEGRKLSAETCITTCNAGLFIYGGMGNNKCSCDNTDHGGEKNNATCMSLTCPGDQTEFCGAKDSLVLYKLA